MKSLFHSANELERREFMATTSRALLGVGTIPLLGSSLAHGAIPGARPATAKNTIFLYMGGGMTHIDTLDPKPGKEEQGPVKSIKTKIPGIHVSEHLPKLAKVMDKIAIIRSMNTTQGAHRQAVYYNHASYTMRGTITHPTLGAWVSRLAGRINPTLPASVLIGGGSDALGKGFFPASHSPLPLGNPNNGLEYSEMPGYLQDDDFHKRLTLAEKMNDQFNKRYTHNVFTSYRELYDEALKLMKSSDLAVFDLTEESPKLRAAYGQNPFGQGCLLARRLVEQNVRFVEVNYGGWDTHNDHFDRIGEKLPVLDQALSSLILDLERRGLLEETLVVLTTDFGRTPEINGVRAGRDHHPQAYSTLMAGGGIAGGQVYGATDKTASEVIDNKVSPPDFNATIAHAMGLPLDEVLTSPNGRPFTVAHKGKPVTALFG